MGAFARVARPLVVLFAMLVVPMAAGAQEFASDRFSVTVVGAGPDVILIPGLGASPRVWAELAGVPGYRYHLIHVAGFAGAPVGGNGEAPVLSPLADEVARYIADHAGGVAMVVGHSMGGTVGLMVAARYPQLVSRLVVVDVPPFAGIAFMPEGATAEEMEAIADAIAGQMLAADPQTRRQQAEMQITAMTDALDKRPIAIEDMLASDPQVMARAFREQIVTDLGPELPAISAPTLVLYVTPEGAPITDAQLDQYYAEAYAPLPGVSVRRVPDSGHMIMWDQPELFQREVAAFMAGGS